MLCGERDRLATYQVDLYEFQGRIAKREKRPAFFFLTCVFLGCEAAEPATKSREVGRVGVEGAGMGEEKEDKFEQDIVNSQENQVNLMWFFLYFVGARSYGQCARFRR